jgi:hypothetical protein
VVGVAAAVVANGGANFLGDLGQVADQVVNGFGGQIGMIGQGGVEVVDVGLVVLAVVDLFERKAMGRAETSGASGNVEK